MSRAFLLAALFLLPSCRLDPGPDAYAFPPDAPEELRAHHNLSYKFPGIPYEDIYAFRLTSEDAEDKPLALHRFARAAGHLMIPAHRADLYIALALRPVGYPPAGDSGARHRYAFVYFYEDTAVAALSLNPRSGRCIFHPNTGILVGKMGFERLRTIVQEINWD